MKKTRILIVDDHPVVRKGLAHILAEHPGFSVVGEADDGLKAIESVARLKPDIVILDITMPGIDGIEVARRLKEGFPGVKVIIYSMHQDRTCVSNALRSGARGYVLKGACSNEITSAITTVLEDKYYVSPLIAGEMLGAFVLRQSVDAFDSLSPREKEVLKLIAAGCKGKEIASKLSVSASTAKKHRHNLMRKLSVDSIAGLVKVAINKGLI